MFSIDQSRPRRFVAAAAALIVLTAACSSADVPDLESLGLKIDTDIQAGSTLEVAVPKQAGTTVSVATSPAGVTAAITPDRSDGFMLLTVNVEFDTPRGAYNLGLRVDRDGKEYELGWPFEVTEPGSTGAPFGPVATTLASQVEAVLTVDGPQPGAVFVSSDLIRGLTTSTLVGYRLWGGATGTGNVLAEGTLTTVDGTFESPLVFTNTCCIEMQLEVFQIDSGGLVVTTPLAYPEFS